MIILTKRIKDDTQTSSTIISKNEYVQIVTEKGCFNISLSNANANGITVFVPSCDKLTITPAGSTMIHLDQIKG